METLYLTNSEFQQFLMARYFVVSNKHKNQAKQTSVIIQTQSAITIGKRQLIFFSCVDEINLPNADSFPQLRTLFGLPAGLLTARNEPNNAKQKAPKTELQFIENRYLAWRRSLLNACVWGIKSFEAAQVEYFFNSYLPQLNQATYSLYRQIFLSIAMINKLPEQRPTAETITDTVFDYQLIWFGKTIGECVLQGNKMTNEQRNWFLTAGENGPQKQALFGDADLLIVAYQMVMKMYNTDKMHIENCIAITETMENIDTNSKYNVIMWAMLLIGLLDKKTENYFMAAGAKILFKSLECNAFEHIFGTKTAFAPIDGFENIKDAVLIKHENCVRYYQLKNPNIAGKRWELYDKQKPTQWPDAILLIEPRQIIDFLVQQNKVFSIRNFLNSTLFITKNEEEYIRLSAGNNVLFYDGTSLRGNVLSWEQGQAIRTDSAALKEKFSFLSDNIEVSEHLFSIGTKHWILLTSDFELAPVSQSILQSMAKQQMPEAIYVFNFNSPENEIEIEINKHWNHKKTSNKQSDFKPTEIVKRSSKPAFQSQLEQLFGSNKVRIVSKQADDQPWEMVNMGINMLQKTTLENSTIIETRFANKASADYEAVIRSLSDVIVYDAEQRYMFMNL